jgi:hypothetical protein
MKINPDHAQFVQDLVLRITSNPDFNPANGNIDKACATAFAVGRKFFPLWEAERTELEVVEPKPEPKKARRQTEGDREARRQDEGQQRLNW